MISVDITELVEKLKRLKARLNDDDLIDEDEDFTLAVTIAITKGLDTEVKE